MTKDKDPLENYHPDLFPRLAKIGKVIGWCLTSHQLSPISEHEFNHGGGPMLDRELEKTDALNNMNQVYFPEETEL